MTAGLIVLCRYSSRRLPGKILRKIAGRTVLDHILDRLRHGVPGHPVVVATSGDPDDDPIARHCAAAGVSCFRGPLDDVAGRFLACAEQEGWQYAVRVNGDNLFADTNTLRCLLAAAETGAYDFLTNVPGRTFPYGMSVEVLRVSFFRGVVSALEAPEDREHVTRWLYERPEVGRRFVLENDVCPEARGLKLALDTEEDLERSRIMMESMTYPPHAYGLAEITALARAAGA